MTTACVSSPSDWAVLIGSHRQQDVDIWKAFPHGKHFPWSFFFHLSVGAPAGWKTRLARRTKDSHFSAETMEIFHWELETCKYREDGMWHHVRENQSVLMSTSESHAAVGFPFGITPNTFQRTYVFFLCNLLTMELRHVSGGRNEFFHTQVVDIKRVHHHDQKCYSQPKIFLNSL